jgi:two-component system chemotaxis response regulator CheY
MLGKTMPTNLGDLMVVLAEPSATQRKIVSGYLNALGIHQVTTVGSGQEALSLLQEYQPDLIISTLYLPDMTGTDLVHSMRNDPQLADVGFILISSETRFRYLDPIRQAGAIAILPKPFTRDELKVALDTTIEHLDPDQIQFEDYDPESLQVLIVDDSGFARRHIMRTLGNMGFSNFTEARDGTTALELLQERFFDLIVTDYNMPRMDGLELIEHIRAKSSQASIPVLMVTSEENENRLAAVQQAGVSAICDKPFEPSTVKALITQMFT